MHLDHQVWHKMILPLNFCAAEFNWINFQSWIEEEQCMKQHQSLVTVMLIKALNHCYVSLPTGTPCWSRLVCLCCHPELSLCISNILVSSALTIFLPSFPGLSCCIHLHNIQWGYSGNAACFCASYSLFYRMKLIELICFSWQL